MLAVVSAFAGAGLAIGRLLMGAGALPTDGIVA